MKRLLTAFALLALFAGCTGQKYDDSVILEKIASLEKRVQTLEGNMSAIQSALQGKFVQKVEEYKNDDGIVVGITVTYVDGDVKHITVSTADASDGPVLCVLKNGAGELCWALDWGGTVGKVILKDADGNDVPVYMTPTFEIGEDGHLYMTLNGDKIDLGNVVGPQGPQGEKGEGSAAVQDGIVKAIEVTDEAVIITYDQEGDEDGVVTIPLVNSFKLNIEKTAYSVTGTDPIDIPYTIQNKTAETVVDAYYNAKEFSVAIDPAKIVVTPKSASAEGMILVYADSKTGLTSIVKLTFTAGGEVPEPEVIEKGDVPTEEAAAAGVDYLADAAPAEAISVHVVTNIEFEVAPQATGHEWIHVGTPTKATTYTLPVTLDENTSEEPRTGNIVLYRKGTTTAIQTIVIGQKGKEATPPEPQDENDLSAKGSANCYIIYQAGEYKFKAVKGNSDEAVAATDAVVLWETFNTGDEPHVGDVIVSAEYADGYITFKTPDEFKAGNAVVAARDGDGTILWSWHIWLPKEQVTSADYTAVIGGEMMNMNLGALEAVPATGEATIESLGLRYEWGRKDPFPGARQWDSYPSVAKVAGVIVDEESGKVFVNHTGVASEEDAIKNPTVYYFVGSDDNGSWTDSENTASLWGATKTIYDPCPAGYKVPSNTGTIWTQSDEGWTMDLDNHVVEFAGIRFPFAGYVECYGGSSYGTGADAEHLYLWCAISHDDNRGKCVYFRASKPEGSRYYGAKRGKANAATVRCVKE